MLNTVYIVCRIIEGDYEDSALIVKVFCSRFSAEQCVKELQDNFYKYEIQEWEIM